MKANQEKHIAIVTVVGKYRTGKSYILNRVLLNQNSGF
jgi:GTPase Era involved in 16S rRNA processing